METSVTPSPTNLAAQPKPGYSFWGAVEWFAKNVILPFLPPLIGASTRYVYQGTAKEIFDPSEIAFSLAMVAILVTQCTGQIANKGVRGTVRSLFLASLPFFLMLFALSAIQRLRADALVAEDMAAMQKIIKQFPGGDTLSVPTHKGTLEGFQGPVVRARTLALWSTIIVLL